MLVYLSDNCEFQNTHFVLFLIFCSLMRETMDSTNELISIDLLVCMLYRDLQQAETQVQGNDLADFLLFPY